MHVGAAGPAAFRELGNEPGLDTGDVIVRLANGEERRYHTTDCELNEFGLIVKVNGKPTRFIADTALLEIYDAPEE
jgi:hypothetical protein